MAICMLEFLSGSPPMEVLAVAVGCRMEAAVERAMQCLGVLHADANCNGRDREVGRLEQPPRRLDAELLDERCRSGAGLASEDAGERAWAHADSRRQRFHAQVLVE